MTQVSKVAYLLFCSLLIALSTAPALGDPREDSYPFSSYPMFATKRTAPTFSKVEGQLRSGQREPIPPQMLGTDEVMQAVATVRNASKTKKRALRLCRLVLGNVPPERYTKVSVVRVKYDPISYLVSGPEPLSKKVIASCKPRRKAKKARGGGGSK